MEKQQVMKLGESMVAVKAVKIPLKYFIYWMLMCFLL